MTGDCVSASCDRLTFFDGGNWSSAGHGGFDDEGDRCEREALGRWIPSDGKDKDFRRVL